VDETLTRIERALTAKGITIFCRVDHSGAAASVGLTLPPTKVLLFGSPAAGTPLMVAAPTLAIDLPLKALVWEGADGRVWVALNEPSYLTRRHGAPEALAANLAAAGAIVTAALA
jgi:uncharacterized protein (DUF302 family)